MSSNIKGFLFPAHSYLNNVNADCTSSESQRLVLILLSIPNLGQNVVISLLQAS